MTTLADLSVGNVIIVAGMVAALDQSAGMTLALLGPAAARQGSLVISPAGAFSGNLAQAWNATTVQPVQGLSAVSPGTIMVNNRTGETMVARQVQLKPDGTYQWSASLAGDVWYTTAEWRTAGTATVTG